MFAAQKDDKEENLSRRPSALGGYLLKLKLREAVEISSSISLQTNLPCDLSEVGSAYNPFGRWNRRWLNIESHYLRWYAKVTSNQPSGSMDLRYVTCIRELDDTAQRDRSVGTPSSGSGSSSLGGPASFLIESPERPLVLQCESAQDRDKWVRILHIIVDKAKGGDGSRGVPTRLKNRAVVEEVVSMHASNSKNAAIVPVQAKFQRPSSSSSNSSSHSAGSRGSRSDASRGAAEKNQDKEKGKSRRKTESTNRKEPSLELESTTSGVTDLVIELSPNSSGPTPKGLGLAPTVSTHQNMMPDRKGTIAHRMNSDRGESSPSLASIGSSASGSIRIEGATSSSRGYVSTLSLSLSSQEGRSVSAGDQTLTSSTSVAASLDSEASGQSSMGSRLRRNIQENPVENQGNNGRTLPNRPTSGEPGGQRSVSSSQNLNLGAASFDNDARSDLFVVDTYSLGVSVIGDSVLSRVGKANTPPMPGTSAPAAYRLKKDDIMKKLTGNLASKQGVKKSLSVNVNSPSSDSESSGQREDGEDREDRGLRVQIQAWGSPHANDARKRDPDSPISSGIIGGSTLVPRDSEDVSLLAPFEHFKTSESAVKTFSADSVSVDDEPVVFDAPTVSGNLFLRDRFECYSLSGSALPSASIPTPIPGASNRGGGLSSRIARGIQEKG